MKTISFKKLIRKNLHYWHLTQTGWVYERLNTALELNKDYFECSEIVVVLHKWYRIRHRNNCFNKNKYCPTRVSLVYYPLKKISVAHTGVTILTNSGDIYLFRNEEIKKIYKVKL